MNTEQLISLIVAAYEVIARLYPTKRNLSILDILHSLFNLIVPNIKKSEPEDLKPLDSTGSGFFYRLSKKFKVK
jgi:hypothetical protein